MGSSWSREDEPDRATAKILDAAEKVFIEVGVAAAGMGQVADAAGCSRGTLYRYFPTRHDLHMAYVQRTTDRITELVHHTVAEIDDPRERYVESVMCAVREVRGDPAAAAWFVPKAEGFGMRVSRSSEMVEHASHVFATELLSPVRDDADRELRARWAVRVFVSLLSDPGADEEEERALLERFVAPMLV